jgi:hypothetical protein
MQLRLLSLLPLLTALSACTGHDDMMSDHVELFDEHADAFQAELNDHAERVAAATDLAALSGLEQEHFDRAGDHMSGMRHEMADMMSCTDSSDSRAEAAAAIEDMGRMDTEGERHGAAMKAAEDIDSVHEEEVAHHRTMSEMMDEMRSQTAPMMNGMMSMACSDHED